MSLPPTLRHLLQLSDVLRQGPRLDRALQSVCDTALRVLDAHHASVRVLDESATELLSAARAGEGSREQAVRFRHGEGVAGWVVEHDTLALVPDVATDARFKKAPTQGFSIRSLIAAPLSATTPLGVLAVTSDAPCAFDLDDANLLQLIANCAVPAIERARLEHLAMTDHLTLTYSHRCLHERLQEEISRASRHGSPLSLMMLDLDDFKAINDQLGHAMGDEVLRWVGRCLRESIRCHDVAIRRGGDEFVLILPHADAPQAQALAERVRRSISRSGGHQPKLGRAAVTASIGLASWDGLEESHELEQRADQSMYAAKKAGKNQIRVSATPAKK